MRAEFNCRPISEEEIALVSAILKDDVLGSEQLILQLKNCLIYSKFSDNAVLGFLVSERAIPAMVPYDRNVAAEARALDTDGVLVDVLLHVSRGYLDELEFVKTDGSPLNKCPVSSELFDFQTYWPKN